jgi:hypothetical protein
LAPSKVERRDVRSNPDAGMAVKGEPLAAAAPALGNIKGAAFREFLVFYAKTVDRERVIAAIRAAGSAELSAERPDFGVLQNTWYPAGLVHGLLDRLTQGFDEAELATLAQEAATHIMGVTLRGVYRTMFSLIATPERYARHIPNLWRVHYDNGDPVVLTRGAKEHRITFMSWASHHPFICRLNMAAAAPIYTAMGCKAVRWQRVHCKSMGGEHCVALVTWK